MDGTMDWQTYKKFCDSPDYWSAWMLDQCRELLLISGLQGADRVAETLQADQSKKPLALPSGHIADERTVMFRVSITDTQSELLLAVINQATALERYTQATADRGLMGFAESCEELIRWRASRL
jgi:hypothetical protein